MKVLLSSLFLMISITLFAQQGVIKGKLTDAKTLEPMPFANVYLIDTEYGTTTNIDGEFIIANIKPGVYSISFSFVGYETQVLDEQIVSPSRPLNFDIKMEPQTDQLSEVNIEVSEVVTEKQQPISIRSISAAEILRNPGGNRDISKVLQSLPGVASTVSFRNDIIIRGGSPGENRFYLDGIEVPNINHFATQGSSGGPVGMINVNFISNVDFFASAFPVNRNNALSGVLEFTQKEGNDERLITSFTLGSSDIGLTMDGPVGEKGNFIFSARRSYLQFLFQALQLPFLPTYNDFQYKYTHRINDRNKLTFIGLGAIDDFELNQSVNDGVTDETQLTLNNYILGYLPVNTQWNYTQGVRWQHFGEKGIHNVVLSRSHLNNKAFKYQDNIEVPENLLLDYQSGEIENKFRYEYTTDWKDFSVELGANAELAEYNNSTVNTISVNNQPVLINYNSELDVWKGGLFGSIQRKFFKDRFSVLAGLRTDFNDFNEDMGNPLNQLSPRLTMSYYLNEKWILNGNVAKYYQLPAYTILGYRGSNGDLLNESSQYIGVSHFVSGLEYRWNKFLKSTLEGFYKTYENYPVSVNTGISLANYGGDFGVLGNEAISSIGVGRSYGMEFLVQQRAKKGWYGILAYTFVRSEFETNGEYIPSSWDSRHLLNATAGKSFKNNLEIGLKFRYSGGVPYTPYDVASSSLIQVWDVTQTPIFDNSRLNAERTSAIHGMDLRIDKKWYFKKAMLNLYLDVQNVYAFQLEQAPYLIVQRDQEGQPIVNPDDPTRYLMQEIPNSSGTVLPSIGCMFEF